MRLFRKNIHQDDIDQLLDILQECMKYLKISEDSDWSEMGVSEIEKIIENNIQHLNHGKRIDKRKLTYLFLPTAPLQETSMSNGWADQYMQLSEKFDKTIKKWG